MAEKVCTIPNNMSIQNRVACLYRVSTTKQVDHDDQNQADIPVQRKACRAFVEKMGWTLVIEEQENGVSGFKVSANNRDKIQLLKEAAEKGSFDILLVFMFDRIGRRAEETPFVVEWFVKHGIQVWSVNEGEQRIDSHADRLMNYIRFWQADGESQKTSIRTKAALAQMVQEGRFRGGSVPYGYHLVPTGTYNKRKQEIRKLEINEDEAKVVRMMFDFTIGSGYGRVKIAGILNEMGIKPRKRKSWHESTVGNILHNVTYMGILRSGETRSDPFLELQIISPENFYLAQEIMTERTNEYKEKRTVPLTTRGKTLLSGNIFCGHCGGRLTVTTSGKIKVTPEGERIGIKRIRYICYDKTRKRTDCIGPTGYTSHILDKLIVKVLHQIFDRMHSIEESEIVSRTHRNAMVTLKERVTVAKTECTHATKEYESLKQEVLKSVQGRSSFPTEILSELVNTARENMIAANAHLAELTAEFEASTNKINEIKSDYRRIMEWSDMFDNSDTEIKKMIISHLIKRIDVYEGYRLNIEFNMNFSQFNLGLDIPNEYNTEESGS